MNTGISVSVIASKRNLHGHSVTVNPKRTATGLSHLIRKLVMTVDYANVFHSFLCLQTLSLFSFAPFRYLFTFSAFSIIIHT